jgi:hypothetical protein
LWKTKFNNIKNFNLIIIILKKRLYNKNRILYAKINSEQKIQSKINYFTLKKKDFYKINYAKKSEKKCIKIKKYNKFFNKNIGNSHRNMFSETFFKIKNSENKNVS